MKKKILTIAALIAVVCAVALALVACNSVKSIEDRLVKDGYEVDGYYLGGDAIEVDDTTELEGLMWYLGAYKESDDGTYEQVTVYSFDKNSQAKSAFDYFSDYYKDFDDFTVKKSGNIVAIGTVNAVKTAL